MKKILFRVNSSAEVGMGHLMRCLTLADYLKTNFGTENIFFVNDFQGGIKRVSEKGYELIRIDHSLNENSELNLLSEYLSSNTVNLFVIDINDPSTESMQFYKQYGKVAHFYDLNFFTKFDVDLVMNHHICLRGIAPTDKKIKYLFGPKYFIKPPCFHKIAYKDNSNNKIFLHLGGGDPFNLTCKILYAIKSINENISLIIVIGAAYKKSYKKELNDLLGDYHLPHQLYDDIEHLKMFELIKECSIAITAAGNTLYELSFIGIPSVVISHHENHDDVAREYEKSKACINLGMGKEIDEKKFQSVIETILSDLTKRKSLSTQAQKLVDGLGLERVGRAINNLCRN